MNAVKTRRLSALLSDNEWTILQAIPAKDRAGHIGQAIGSAIEEGKFPRSVQEAK